MADHLHRNAHSYPYATVSTMRSRSLTGPFSAGRAFTREAELGDDGKEAIILAFPAESIRDLWGGAAQRREFG